MLKIREDLRQADGTLDRNRKHVHPGSEAITIIRQKLKFRVPSVSSGQGCVQHFDQFMTSEALYTLGWRLLTVYKE